MARSEDLHHLDGEAGSRFRARRLAVYRLTAAALTLLLLGAVIDAVTDVDVYGVDSDTVRATRDGYELEVRYASVSRPALATPFEIAVRRPGGFIAPITVAVARGYLLLWDLNGIIPSPSAERAVGEWVIWEFDPPTSGDTLRVDYEARIEPAVQSGRRGEVAVLVDDAPVVAVAFETKVRP